MKLNIDIFAVQEIFPSTCPSARLLVEILLSLCLDTVLRKKKKTCRFIGALDIHVSR